MGGFAGALTATIAVCIPSFLIIYLISLFFDQFLSLTLVAKAFLSGVRPCVVALILSTGITMFLESLLQITQIGDAISLNLPGILIFVLLLAADFLLRNAGKSNFPHSADLTVCYPGAGFLLILVFLRFLLPHFFPCIPSGYTLPSCGTVC